MPAGPAREGSRWTFFHGNLQYISQTSLETMGAKRTARVVLDSLGRTVNELVLHEPPPDSLAEFVYRDVTPDGIATAANYVQPYGPTLLRTLGDGGEFVEAVSSRYVVIWRDSTGARITGVARPGARGAPLSERQRKYANEVVSSVKRRTRGAFPFGVPDRHPPLAGIGFDLNGHLWIQHSTPPDAPHEADVFDRRGRWLSVVQWPANVQLRGLVVNGKAALGVAADADGAQSVVRLRISGG
ncbi:MAG TPA: hypothetical protein VFG84_02510 [Gemmatimonadaceae bacterium]|nr:hypothetical protein [Gemmatimonadaceae bacterium]